MQLTLSRFGSLGRKKFEVEEFEGGIYVGPSPGRLAQITIAQLSAFCFPFEDFECYWNSHSFDHARTERLPTRANGNSKMRLLGQFGRYDVSCGKSVYSTRIAIALRMRSFHKGSDYVVVLLIHVNRQRR